MSLINFLKEKKPGLLDQWKALSLLPFQEGSVFFKSTNQFSNPVAWTTEKELNIIYDSITGLVDAKSTDKALDGIVRIRAVQDATPSESTKFLYNFKKLLKDQFKDLNNLKLKNGESISLQEFIELESVIDDLIYRAFDLYMKCREQLFNIKLDQISKGNPLQENCPSALLDELPGVNFNEQIKPFQGEKS
jgi:hypothetical protein